MQAYSEGSIKEIKNIGKILNRTSRIHFKQVSCYSHGCNISTEVKKFDEVKKMGEFHLRIKIKPIKFKY